MTDKKFIILNSCNEPGKDGNEVIYGSDASDGYHTFTELYKHRYALFYALIKAYDSLHTPLSVPVKCWKSKLHSDGTMFNNSFIVGMTIKTFEGEKQITYHYPLDWWYRFKVIELERAPEYDGHTPDDVIERLLGL